MKLGLRRGTVALEPHDSEWEIIAQQTIMRLRAVLQETAIDIQHIGSTAIRGICAKPIIDIVIGVSDFDSLLSENAALTANGFLFRGSDLPEQYLYVCGEGELRTHHIHAVQYGSQAWNNYINLRDYLNAHPDDARAYSDWKQSLAKQFPNDRETYTAMKSDMIQEILQKAGAWRRSSMEIRFLSPDDDLYEISSIYEQSWKYAYRGIIPQAYLDSIPEGRWADGIKRAGMRSLVLTVNGRFIGTAGICKSRWAEFSDYGEIVSIYLLPDAIGKGYGRQLLKRCVSELDQLGLRSVLLWVLEDNTRARHFYEQNGFIFSGVYRDDEIGGKHLREMLYIRKEA